MKFKLFPTGNGNDPLGFDTPVVVDLPDRRTTADSAFRLGHNDLIPEAAAELDPGDVFSALGTGASSGKATHSFPGFRLVKAEQGAGDYFESAPSTVGSGSPVTLARAQKDDSLFAAFGPEAAPEEEPGTFRKGAETEFHKFAQFSKVEETADGDIIVYGIATLEQPDLDNEVCHYPTAKDAYNRGRILLRCWPRRRHYGPRRASHPDR